MIVIEVINATPNQTSPFMVPNAVPSHHVDPHRAENLSKAHPGRFCCLYYFANLGERRILCSTSKELLDKIFVRHFIHSAEELYDNILKAVELAKRTQDACPLKLLVIDSIAHLFRDPGRF